MATETTVWLTSSPSAIPWYCNFGTAWDWFMSAAFDQTSVDTSSAMLEHETYDDEASIAVFKGREVWLAQWSLHRQWDILFRRFIYGD